MSGIPTRVFRSLILTPTWCTRLSFVGAQRFFLYANVTRKPLRTGQAILSRTRILCELERPHEAYMGCMRSRGGTS
ncbi:hypothetical protein K439DRAFT_824022 [Ramaria rubella]|nr:hypothetical protein K439DRAFT_824022 [Ramaria rubella]